MPLDSFWVLCLGQNLKQLLIRQEVEAGEKSSLGFQILGQTFLDFVEIFVAFCELTFVIFTSDGIPQVFVLGKNLHSGPPSPVHHIEFGFLGSHFLLDILG